MTFRPVVPLAGLPGWTFLNATLERQSAAFDKSPAVVRDTAYFEQRISTVRSADELVSDRRLLRIALGAFGLQGDIDNRALIRRVLEEGTGSEQALANRLADTRYEQLAAAFGFGPEKPLQTGEPGFGARITALYRDRAFEVAVGKQDQSLRLAMNARRELSDLAARTDLKEDTKWFQIMGTPPLRRVFEKALGLPEAFGQLDLDRQLATFKQKARTQLGLASLSDLSQETARETLIERFLVRDQIADTRVASPTAIAVTLLQPASGAAPATAWP